MEDLWRRVWLYGRMGLVVLVLVFVVQFLLINTSSSGPARIVFWADGGSNFGAVLAAMVFGALVYPLGRLTWQTWLDFRAERARRHEQEAERAWQQAKARGETPVEPAGSPAPTQQVAPSEAESAEAEPADGQPSAADIWTSGEEHDQETPREQN